jgi:4-carboxymuconolactone decarboxylase
MTEKAVSVTSGPAPAKDVARNRPLSPKERRWIELACLGATGDTESLGQCVYRVLQANEVRLEELWEFGLQFAVYCGWARGSEFEGTVRRQWARVMQERGADIHPWPLLENEVLGPADWEERLAAGEAAFRAVTHHDAPRRDTPYNQAGILGFVFGHVWQRPGLSIRERRLVAITCCAVVGSVHALRVHVRSAWLAADLSEHELAELAGEMCSHVPRVAGLRTVLSGQDAP